MSLSTSAKGLCLVFAYTVNEPLLSEIKQIFGTTFIYHPLTTWLSIFCIVWVNTDSISAAILSIVLYESLKHIWSCVSPEKPHIVKLRKLIYRLKQGETLSDSDLCFLDELTPDDVHVNRIQTDFQTTS